MGVIIKYQVTIPEVGLELSNDFYKANYILDADITIKMLRGEAGTSFEIKLYDLPLSKAKEIQKALTDKKGNLPLNISLGYFDGDFEPVLEGRIKKIQSSAEKDKLITKIKGFEQATFCLKETKYEAVKETLKGEKTVKQTLDILLGKVNEKYSLKLESVLLKVEEDQVLKDFTWRDEDLLKLLRRLAVKIDAELLIFDKKVYLGKPIEVNSYEPELDPDVNLAELSPFRKKVPDPDGRNLLKEIKAKEAHGFQFTTLGNPLLKPAQKITALVEDYDKLAGAEFRVHSLIHEFSVAKGYICRGAAVKVCEKEGFSCYERATSLPSPEAIIQSLSAKVKESTAKRPAIEIGQVKSYQPGKHLCELYYGQRFKGTESQPSIRVAVDKVEKQLFKNKPLVSPFAWHKCGLMIPVYQGMKAVVSHNLNKTNDALVTGFIWSEEPQIVPPANKEGDYWLCLPIDFDTAKPPPDSTKAVNDLTANNGKRVIGLKGLKITIGQGKLTEVGKRPAEGGDDEFLIEHASGSKIMIGSDGALTLEAKKITFKGDITIQGKVDIK